MTIMSTLSERQKKIIEILMKSNGKLSGKMLSEIAHISLRTLTGEMKELKKMGLVTSDNTGYTLVNSNPSLRKITMEDLDSKQKILRRLLTENQAIDIDELADEFYISTSSMRKKLKEINEFIQSHDLLLVFHHNCVVIEGTELNKRLMIRKMIYADFPSNTMNIDNLAIYFHDMDVSSLYNIVLSSVEANGYYIQDAYSSSLLLNIIIGLYRISQGIHTPEFDLPDPDTIEYKLAKEVCNRYQKHFHKSVTDGDIAYITSLFCGQVVYTNRSQPLGSYDYEFENKINEILATTFEKYMLEVDYSSYVHNISLHVFDLIKRSNSNNFVITHIHSTMKQKCPFVYDVAVSLAKQLELAFHITIPDGEIGFLSVHIGFIIENSMEDNQYVDILLIANHYQGIAEHIQKKLLERHKDFIKVHIMDPSSTTIPKQNIDFVISTVPLEIIGKQIIHVSPFFDVVERAQVDEAIAKYLKEKKLRRNNVFLTSCFIPSLFFRDETITNKTEAIQFLGKKMVDFGIVQDDFINSVFEREKLSPTCFFDAFAIPHALNMDAKKTMMGVLINEKGIQWDDTEIKLCLLIAIQKKDIIEFSNVYNNTVYALCDYERLNRLFKCSTSAEFVNILKQ